MKKHTKLYTALCLGLAVSTVLLTSCNGVTNGTVSPVPSTSQSSKLELAATYSTKLVEDRSVYNNDKPESVVNFYLTIPEHNMTAEHPLSWIDFNSINRPDLNTDEHALEVLLQEGSGQGPASGMFGYGDTRANGVINIRGKSTIRAKQKSYKIKLYDEAGLWREQRTINLVKHAYDSTRMRNKLSFDLFKSIPNFTSLRTQFVHLYVKDMTAGGNSQFVDYGLYTQIEQPNKAFLRSHGLDPNAHLYKAVNFEFREYPDNLKMVDAPDYDEIKFNMVLESKGSNDHKKLLDMLADINNYNLDIDETFDKHFDRDNFLTWMAVNILMDNFDTINQNFYIYSPLNSDKWFFLPWDYDGAWGDTEIDAINFDHRAPWQRGIANYWGNTLQSRFFKNPANVDQLIDKIEELKTIINPDETSKWIETYKPVVYPFVSREPDLDTLTTPIYRYLENLEQIKQLPQLSERKFKESLESPMPFFMGEVEFKKDTALFKWGVSYDLQGDDVKYHVQIAKGPSFSKPVYDNVTSGVSVEVKGLAKGKYFWKVIAEDAKGNQVPAFDTYKDIDRNSYFGVREFYVD